MRKPKRRAFTLVATLFLTAGLSLPMLAAASGLYYGLGAAMLCVLVWVASAVGVVSVLVGNRFSK